MRRDDPLSTSYGIMCGLASAIVMWVGIALVVTATII